MGKKKKKQDNPIQEAPKVESKPRRSRFLGWGLAGIVLTIAATAGIVGSFYERKKEEDTTTQAVYEASLKERWSRVINEEGIFLSERELQEKYEVFRENERIKAMPIDKKRSLDQILGRRIRGAAIEFEKNSVPEMYTEDVFYNFWTNNQGLKALFVPNKITPIFKLPGNLLVEELCNNLPKNDVKLTEKVLSCAILIAHKKLERRDKLIGFTIDQLMKNLREGIGDCSDYTYSVANIYYSLCRGINRDDLYSKIRVMAGVHLNSDEKFIGYHSWIQLLDVNKKWNDLEMNCDKIRSDDPVNMSTPALYILHDSEGGFYVPTFSSTVVNVNDENQIISKAHVFPQKVK